MHPAYYSKQTVKCTMESTLYILIIKVIIKFKFNEIVFLL